MDIHKYYGRLLILLQLRTSRGYLLQRTDWLLAPIVYKITPLHGPHGKHRLLLFFKDACLQLRCLATDVLLFRAFAWRWRHRKHSFPYIVVTFLRGEVFTGRRIETAVLLLLPVFVAVRMFTDLPLFLRNLATDCLPRICLRGNLFTKPLPSNGCICNSIQIVLREVGWDGTIWIDVAQDKDQRRAFVNTVMKLRVS
jgi:hypothetical protein